MDDPEDPPLPDPNKSPKQPRPSLAIKLPPLIRYSLASIVRNYRHVMVFVSQPHNYTTYIAMLDSYFREDFDPLYRYTNVWHADQGCYNHITESALNMATFNINNRNRYQLIPNTASFIFYYIADLDIIELWFPCPYCVLSVGNLGRFTLSQYVIDFFEGDIAHIIRLAIEDDDSYTNSDDDNSSNSTDAEIEILTDSINETYTGTINDAFRVLGFWHSSNYGK